MTATNTGANAPTPTKPTQSGTDLSKASVEQLAVRWQQGRDSRARDVLFERFLPLARKLASRYANRHEPLEDLIQVASVGLLGAIERFDPERGVRFPAFAVPTILGELKRHFRNTGWSAHVPRGIQELALRTDDAVHTLTARHGRSPRIDEVAQFLEVGAEEVLMGLDASTAHYAMSLDGPAAANEEGEPVAVVDGLGDHEQGYGVVEAKLSLQAAMRAMQHQERRAVQLRMDEGLKQSEIAERMGCSQMQVSRLLRGAAERVRELTEPELTAPRTAG